MNGRVILGNPPPLPAPAKAMSSTATRPKTCAGLGNLRGVPKARVCIAGSGKRRDGAKRATITISAEGHMRLRHKSWIGRVGVLAFGVLAFGGLVVGSGVGVFANSGPRTADAQPGPPQAPTVQC